jgi:hypothetical protein
MTQLSNENSFEVEFARNLFSLECLVSEEHFFCTEEEFIAAMGACWDLVRRYSTSADDILSIHFISTLHKTLATKIGAPDPGKFVDDGGVDGSWSYFTEELNIKETIAEFGACENCYIIAQLFWGGHLPNLQLSVGWLCINTLALRYGYSPPSYPPKNIHEELLECLECAGPDCWDAESLRALIG